MEPYDQQAIDIEHIFSWGRRTIRMQQYDSRVWTAPTLFYTSTRYTPRSVKWKMNRYCRRKTIWIFNEYYYVKSVEKLYTKFWNLRSRDTAAGWRFKTIITLELRIRGGTRTLSSLNIHRVLSTFRILHFSINSKKSSSYTLTLKFQFNNVAEVENSRRAKRKLWKR